MDATESVYKNADQDGVHPYDSYDRTYMSSLEDYNARILSTLTYEFSYGIEGVLTPDISKTGIGALRWVPGPILLSRTYLTEPAEISGDAYSNLDYSLEVMVETSTGEILHLHANWVQIDLGGGLDSENETMQGIGLSGIEALEDDIADACAD